MTIEDITINQVPEEDSKILGDYLDHAMEHQLELEVIYYALVSMKNDPSQTPIQALFSGITEWIK